MPVSHHNNFNLLRLLAAAQVVYMHSTVHLGLSKNPLIWSVLAQFNGVAVFFVISGFLVTDSYMRSESAGSFFFKRALRIYPALVVNIAVLEALMYCAGQSPGMSPLYPFYFLIYAVTASNNIAGELIPRMYSFNGFFHGYPSQVLWTLTVELSFYLVLPFFLTAAKYKRWLGTLLVLAAMAGSFKIVFFAFPEFYQEHEQLGITVPPYFWVFGIGILIRLHWDRLKPFFERRLLLWAVAYGAVIAIALLCFDEYAWLDYKLHPQWTGFFRVIAMGCVVISAAYSFKGLTARLRLDEIDLSYGLYLWHMLVIMTLIGLGYTHSDWLWPVVYGGGLSLAALSWFCVEKPALAWKNYRRASPAIAA